MSPRRLTALAGGLTLLLGLDLLSRLLTMPHPDTLGVGEAGTLALVGALLLLDASEGDRNGR